MTWLNRREGRAGELSRLVTDGWSWIDIGRAMHLAGISYRTGFPLSADTLRKKASAARTAARTKSVQRPGNTTLNTDMPEASPVQKQAPSPPPPDYALLPPPSRNDIPAGDEEPTFKPASLIGHTERKPPEVLSLPAKPAVPAPTLAIDVDAVLARFIGRK
jgi:hypothetical protein